MTDTPYSPSRNSFHLTRLGLAVLVILTHCYTLQGIATPLNRLTAGQMNEGTLAVDGFLVVSGFLITQSALRSRNVLRFLRNRALRIFPALACALVFTALIVGGLAYEGTYRQYLQLGDGGPLSYIRHWLTLNVQKEPWGITGVFADNHVSGVNVSLWTIKFEVFLYLLMALLMLFGLHRRRASYVVLFAAFAVLQVLQEFFGLHLWQLSAVSAWVLNKWNYANLCRTGYFFFAGTLLYAYRDKLPRRWYLAVIAAMALLLGGMLKVLRPVHLLAMPYLLIYLAGMPWGQGVSRLGDWSFGLYVYSYPLQQLLLHIFPGLHPMLLFALTLLLATPLSALSWRVIERPALMLKHGLRRTA